MKLRLVLAAVAATVPLCAQSYYAPNLQRFDPPVYVRGMNGPCGVAGSEWINILTLNTWLCGTDGQWHANTGGSGGYEPFAGAGVVKATGAGNATTPAQSSDLFSIMGFTPVNPASLSTVATSGLYSDLLSKPTLFNQDLQANGTGVPQRPTFNLQAGSNVTITPSDNGTKTTFTIDATAASGIQPTGGANYLPFVTSGSTSQAATQSNLLGILGSPYNALAGAGSKIATVTGATSDGHCASYNTDGSIGDSGGACAGSPSPTTINYTPSWTGANTLTQQTANMKVIQFCQDGGKCDGTTEDTTAWNSMAAKLNGNAARILVPTGVTILAHSPQVNSNMIVECGKGATFKDSGSANFSMLAVTFQHDWTVSGCTFDQAGVALTNSNNAVIYLQGDTNFTFANNKITNSGAPSPNTAGILVFQDNGGKIDNNTIDETITGTQIDINNGVASQQAVQASAVLGSNALDNLLWIQAATPGTAGNSQTVTIANDGASKTLSFSGTSTALTIHLATDASGNSTSTAATIISGFRGNALEKNFRVLTHDTATGIVAAVTSTTLAGGVDSFNPIVVSNNRLNGSMANGIHVEAAGGSAGTYCNVEVYGNLITNVWDWSDYQATSSAHSGENGNGIDIDSCSGVHVHDNIILHTDFSGVRIFNGWYNDIGPNNEIGYAGEQSLYAEFNSQGNKFHDNYVHDGLFGVNDNNAELRTDKQFNEYDHNKFLRIFGTGIICNACIAKDNTFEGVIIGVQISGGGSGGYNSQLVDNTCIVSQDPTLPPTLNCIGLSSGYGGTSTLIEGNHTVGTPTFGHIWGVGNPSGHITNVTLGSPTTVTFSTGTPATGNLVCFFGIPLFSTFQLNGQCYTATVSGSTLTVPVDSTTFTPWIAASSPANPNSANGWRFPGFWYDGDITTSPAAFNANMLVLGETFKDAIKGTPQSGSWGIISNDNCTSGTLSSLGSGTGTNAKYFTAQGWTCW